MGVHRLTLERSCVFIYCGVEQEFNGREVCSGCQAHMSKGKGRYKCVNCDDFALCTACYRCVVALLSLAPLSDTQSTATSTTSILGTRLSICRTTLHTPEVRQIRRHTTATQLRMSPVGVSVVDIRTDMLTSCCSAKAPQCYLLQVRGLPFSADVHR